MYGTMILQNFIAALALFSELTYNFQTTNLVGRRVMHNLENLFIARKIVDNKKKLRSGEIFLIAKRILTL